MIKPLLALATASALVLGLTACGSESEDYRQRKSLQKTTTLANSLEKRNLTAKLERENRPNAVRYVYLMNFGQIVGYYVIKGKVSSSSSQLAPEEDIVRSYGGDGYVVDSAQDDGTYGSGDDGVFFFLADGTMVETTLDYVQSDQPLALDVPRLGGKS